MDIPPGPELQIPMKFAIFVLITLVTYVMGSRFAAYARARGGNPWIWATIAVGGFWLLGVLVPQKLMAGPNAWLYVMAALAWVGILALCVRFVLGTCRRKPSGMWACKKCKMLNQGYAVVCDACQTPYEAQSAKS